MAYTPIDPIATALPSQPQTEFDANMANYMRQLPDTIGQMNTLGLQTDQNAIAAAASQVAAAASAAASANSATQSANSASAAAAAINAPKWVSGQVLAYGDCRWSPTDSQTYRTKVALNPSTVDPAADAGTSGNWTLLGAQAFGSIEVFNISADTSLTSSSKNVVRVASTVRGASLLLPAGTAIAGRTGAYPIKNVGNFAIPLRDQSGTLLALLPGAGSSCWAVCEDTSTTAGQWFVMCPESKPAQAFSAATCEAVTTSWLTASSIPGTTNKALVAWNNNGLIRAAIATRNPTTNAVTIGAIVTVYTSNDTTIAMVHALTSTTALAAAVQNASDYRVISLTLDTTTNVITVGGNATLTAGPTQAMFENVQQLDATRIAWLTSVSASTTYLNIATYAATPTFTQTSINSTASSNLDAALVHVGGGNLMVIGSNANTLYSTSGNTPSQLSTQSYSGASFMPATTFTRTFGFAAGSGNKATFYSVHNPTSGSAPDSVRSIIPSGTTVPVGPTNANGLTSALSFTNTTSFIAGSSYCVVGTANANTPGSFFGVRVMRYFNDQLSEVAFGGIEGLPVSRASGSASIRVAAVSGQYCIAIGLNGSQQPQVFTLEVVKA